MCIFNKNYLVLVVVTYNNGSINFGAKIIMPCSGYR